MNKKIHVKTLHKNNENLKQLVENILSKISLGETFCI